MGVGGGGGCGGGGGGLDNGGLQFFADIRFHLL